MLAFIAGKVDMTFPNEVTPPMLKDVKQQAPQAICDLVPTNISINLIVNRETPPFDNPDISRAMALTLDRKAFVDILYQGEADIGGVLLPPPAGVWGLPADILKTTPGYGTDGQKTLPAAPQIMEDVSDLPCSPLTT